MSRTRNELRIYDKAKFDPESGELQVWDEVLFPAIIRKYQYHFLDELLSRFTDPTVLDVGCGAGWGSHYVAQSARLVVGIDVSQALVHGACQRAGRNETYLLADGINLPINASSVDVILSIAALHHLPTREALSEWHRVLKRNGHLVLMEPNRLNPIAFVGRQFFPTETHTKDERPLTPIVLRQLLLEHGWKIVHWETHAIFSFAISRVLRLTNAPPAIAKALTPTLDWLERELVKLPFFKQIGWEILCEARKEM